jgi:hypothetical protein
MIARFPRLYGRFCLIQLALSSSDLVVQLSLTAAMLIKCVADRTRGERTT